MIQGGVMVYTCPEYEYEFTIPNIYTDNEWKQMRPYIYINGEWKVLGAAGCPMVYWYDSNGNLMTDTNGKYILVRDMKDWLYLYTNQGEKVKDNTNRYIRIMNKTAK